DLEHGLAATQALYSMVNKLLVPLLLPLPLLFTHELSGQSMPDTVTAQQSIMAEVGGFGSSATQTPFWFRSRQYGTVPLKGPAGIFRVGITRQFGDLQNNKKIHAKVSVEGVANV